MGAKVKYATKQDALAHKPDALFNPRIRDVIPQDLQQWKRWVVWRWTPQQNSSGEWYWTKPPFIAGTTGQYDYAKTNDPDTWRSFETAVTAWERDQCDGIGLVFTDTPIVGVEGDDCMDPETGELSPAGQDVCQALNTYTERSPSGTGFHSIVFGSLPDNATRFQRDGFEMYDHRSPRYFTFTGERIDSFPGNVAFRAEELKALHARIIEPQQEQEAAVPAPAASLPTDLDDRELIEKAMNATNGDKFASLWRGDVNGYASQSEADAALCCHLAFWTGKDMTRIDQLFRQSNLYRDKWERDDYRNKTLARAIEQVGNEQYDPDFYRNGAGTDEPAGDDSSEGSTKRTPMKDKILELALAEDITLFTDQHNTPYCRTPRNGHYEILAVDGRDYADWLSWLLYTQDGRTCSPGTLDPARAVLRAKAKFEGPRHKLHNRTAWAADNVLYYDLTDSKWRAVKVTPEGWEIDTRPPVLFRRLSHQEPQTEPDRVFSSPYEELQKIFKFVNISGEANRLLFTVHLVSNFIPDIAHPIIALHGEQGSGKSFALKIARSLPDPSAVSTLSIPWKPDEFVQQLDHHWCAYYDNLNSLSEWQQDAICRAVTGEGHTKRQLYTDEQDIIFTYRRCIALNGINIVTTRPDLLDRSLLFELDTLQGERKTEAELLQEFHTSRPGLLGAIFDVLVLALNTDEQQALAPARQFRLADWAAWGWRIAEALGGYGDRFIQAYAQATQSKAETSLDLHPLGQALRSLMQKTDRWQGTPAQLLEALKPIAITQGIDTDDKLWPGSASWVGRRLTEIRPDLRTYGITYESEHDGTQRKYTIKRE